MKLFFKKHIGVIVLLAIILAFPTSMSTQARLNMRVIITGLAIDKTADGYEVTAQTVKPSPSSESSGTGASINFISDKGDTIVSALSKLSYKSGKVAGFSHTNFILLGKELLNENISKIMDYFLRDNIIKDSVLLLVAKESAKDEIKKTKDLELSVGLGLQKVFVYKEKESDGTMTSLLSFANNSYGNSKTALVSVLSLTDESSSDASNSSDSQKSSGADTQQKSGGGTENSDGEKPEAESSGSQGGMESQGGSSSESEQSTQSSSSSDSGQKKQYFEALTPLACFVSGKYIGLLEEEDEIMGYMYSNSKSHAEDLSIEGLNFENLKNARVGVDIKDKTNKKKIRFEGGVPCLDIYVNVTNASIKEIENDTFYQIPTEDEFEYIKTKLEEEIAKKVAKTFEKSKELKADVFSAYDIANKFHYKKIKNNFNSMEEFIDKLKINVIVDISRLEY